jgi:glycosyltransferase involved in cell wall biosynthesis
MSHTHTQQKSNQTGLHGLNLAIVGLARNCEKTIRADIQRIKRASSNAKSIKWLIVESDSTDNTVIELKKLQNEVENFQFAPLGMLAKTIPKRTERISYCRNFYAEKIRTDDSFKDINFIAVVDLDGINDKITQKAFESCWERSDWDMCAANQDGPYFDIWALRHEEWCPGDCWAQYKFLSQYSLDIEKNLWGSVYSKMITIAKDSEWIEVDSAFGGLAIYKKTAFDVCRYVGITEKGEEFCEHVHFHQQLKSNGAKLYINPKLINATLTEHTIHLKK